MRRLSLMKFNKYFHLEGKHAFLSPSQYHWIRYDDQRLIDRYSTHMAAMMGTRLHAFAEEAINLKIKLPRTKQTINMFINDAIGFDMSTEQILYYSDHAFGTADAISFKNNFLRIHDFKSGKTPASMDQLEVYTALFCLEYGHKINDITVELRIYQNDEILIHTPEPENIMYIMEKIVKFDKMISDMIKES